MVTKVTKIIFGFATFLRIYFNNSSVLISELQRIIRSHFVDIINFNVFSFYIRRNLIFLSAQILFIYLSEIKV